ncbi:DUF4981 domain-containing protein [Streptomyces sp. FXJ1.172]|uniref:DUF4981 domain-containing protein n=1 Tax=Streptomyces sp. FXJ1.172 TaxID=710705 RepID=UPI003FA741C2
MSDGRPAGRMDAGPYVHRGSRAPVGIRCLRHEGIVLVNDHAVQGLGRLAATWELVRADGRILTAPAELPDLRPGQTAAVSLPFRLPRDGGAAWLTLRVVTTADEPWAPRGTELCAPRVRLPANGAARHAGAESAVHASRPARSPVPAPEPATATAGNRRRNRPLRAL